MAKTTHLASSAFEDQTESLMDWMRAHSRQVTIGVIAVAAVGLGAWLWRSAANKKELNASRALAEAQVAFGSGNMALAQSDLQRLVQRYGGTSAAIQSRILLAQAYFAQNKIADGLRVLDEAGEGGAFASSLHAVRAAGLEQAGKPLEAAAEYLQASQAAIATADKASYKGDAARAYQAGGKPEEAVKIWEDLAADETGPLSGEARVRLGELTAKPVQIAK